MRKGKEQMGIVKDKRLLLKAVAAVVTVALLITGLDIFAAATEYDAPVKSQLETWIQLSDNLLSQKKNYVEGYYDFIVARAKAKTALKNGTDYLASIQKLKDSWGNLVYTKRIQFAKPSYGTYNEPTDNMFGEYKRVSVGNQPQIEWILNKDLNFWKNAESIDFSVSGYASAAGATATDPNWGQVLIKNSADEYIPLCNENGESFDVFGKFGAIEKEAKKITIPAEYIDNQTVYGSGKIELLIFKLGENRGTENTVTVGSLFATVRYSEVLPMQPAYADKAGGTVKYGSSVTVSVPAGTSAFYTVDGTEPTVFSKACADGEKIAVKNPNLKILSVCKDGSDTILSYTYTPVKVTRNEIIAALNRIGQAGDYSNCNDIFIAGKACSVIWEKEEDEALAESFAESVKERVKLSDYIDFANEIDISLQEECADTLVFESVNSADENGMTEQQKAHKRILCDAINTACTVIPEANIVGGTILVSNAFAAEGEKVTVEIVPDGGYRLKPDSLAVISDIGAIFPQRKNFRNGIEDSNSFLFVMPSNSKLVRVSAEFVSAVSIGNAGRAQCVTYDDGQDALKLIYRCYNVNEIFSYGVILTSWKSFYESEETEFDLSYGGKITKISNKSRNFEIFDRCSDYTDFSVAVTYDKNSKNKSEKLISRGYAILKDGTIQYSDILICSYNELANSNLSDDMNIYGNRTGANGIIKNVFTNENSIVCGNMLEMKIDIDGSLNNITIDNCTVDAVFTSPDGVEHRIPGFYSEESAYSTAYNKNIKNGKCYWKLRYTPSYIGEWKYKLILKTNGQTADAQSGMFVVKDGDSKLQKVSVRGKSFVFEDGTNYTPIGINVAWEESAAEYLNYIKNIADNGGNYIRIWLSEYGIGLLDTNGRAVDSDYNSTDAAYLDAVFRYAEERGVYIQLVPLFHGMFSSAGTDTAWVSCSFNAVNKYGYLQTPTEFWVNERAKSEIKNYFRYIVARYGYSNSLLSVELCNEILSSEGITETVADEWCREISDYIREIDDNRNLITVSSASSQIDLIYSDCFDYINIHRYSDSLERFFSDISTGNDCNKPLLISEAGYSYSEPVVNTTVVHTQNWAAYMGGSVGGAMSWYWPEIEALTDQNGTNPIYRDMRYLTDFSRKIGRTGLPRTTITQSNLYDYDTKSNAVGFCCGANAYLWLYDKDAINGNSDIHIKSDITVSMPDGDYQIVVYDTYTGNKLSANEKTSANGWISFSVNNWSKDVVIEIIKEK